MKTASSFNYPSEMAAEVGQRWLAAGHPPELLPAPSELEHILNTLYQASLLREEGEPVRCRVVLGSPELFESASGTPWAKGLHVLRFQKPCLFSSHELRKLSGAAGYYRSMLGIEKNESGEIRIWGMVVTGTYWVNRIEGGRFHGYPLPPNLVVQLLGPGHLIVATGYTRVLETMGGQFLTEGFDPFHAVWLQQKFRSIRQNMLEEILGEYEPSRKTRLCELFIRNATQSVIRRMLSLVRTRGHGGMLVYLPEGLLASELPVDWFRFRVVFSRNEASLQFRKLISQLLGRVIQLGQEQGLELVTWDDYQTMQDPELTDLEEALIDFAHFLADLMSVDGALVIDCNFRTIGFGGEILGESHVSHIHRALDLEATRTIQEPADSSGTRHRSAYRLVSGVPDAIALVVSQDGAIRFVAHHQNKLTYWPYLP